VAASRTADSRDAKQGASQFRLLPLDGPEVKARAASAILPGFKVSVCDFSIFQHPICVNEGAKTWHNFEKVHKYKVVIKYAQNLR